MAREQYIGTADADIVEIGRSVFQNNDRQVFVAVSQKLVIDFRLPDRRSFRPTR